MIFHCADGSRGRFFVALAREIERESDGDEKRCLLTFLQFHSLMRKITYSLFHFILNRITWICRSREIRYKFQFCLSDLTARSSKCLDVVFSFFYFQVVFFNVHYPENISRLLRAR